MSATDDAKEKIGRAVKHFVELKSAEDEYHRANPIQAYEATSADGKQIEVRVKETLPPAPARVALIAGDVIHNLRSALSVAVFDLAKDPENSDFPTVRWDKPMPATVWPDRVRKCMGNASPPAKAAVNAVEAYRGGKGEALALLHELDVEDKHHLLVLTAIRNTVYEVDASAMLRGAFPDLEVPAMEPLSLKPAVLTKAERDAVIFAYPVGTKLVAGAHRLRFELCFETPACVATRPLLRTLSDMAVQAEAAVKLIATLS